MKNFNSKTFITTDLIFWYMGINVKLAKNIYSMWSSLLITRAELPLKKVNIHLIL